MAMNGSFRTLTFDGEISTDYGVYISGEGTFNAPLRDVEMITIPGRNGAYALDNGRFENIEVTYPAGLFGVDEADFAEKISAFRNFLCSRVGYVRLEDDYNPDEYRLAVYKSGLEVDPELLKAGRFNLVFECKPQRFLKFGERPISLFTGSNTIRNETRFESSPLLMIRGDGIVNINGEDITIYGREIGFTELSYYRPWPYLLELVRPPLNNGDSISINEVTIVAEYEPVNLPGDWNIISCTPDWGNITGSLTTNGNAVTITMNQIPFLYGQEANVFICGLDIRMSNGSQTVTVNSDIRLFVSSSNKNRFNLYVYVDPDDIDRDFSINANSITGISTKRINEVIYIDLDIDEAYIMVDGKPVFVNNLVSIPPISPKLKVGDNTIILSGNITSGEIIERNWKV